ncbi:MAG: hypothetical protein ACLFV3_12245, partial [Phycisphaeraceae bacterium]
MSSLTSRLPFISFFTDWFRRGGKVELNAQDAKKSGKAVEEGDGSVVLQRNQPPRPARKQEAWDEMVSLIHNLKGHMEAQSQRSERLLEMMEGLPEALKSLPEAHRNQAQLLQAIRGQMEQQTLNSQGLTQAIESLSTATDRQEQAMTHIQGQLDASREDRQQLNSSFSALSDTLGQMSQSTQAGTDLLHRLADRSAQSEAQMQQLFARNQRQSTIMSVVSWAL